MAHVWTPTSWQACPNPQAPDYQDKAALKHALGKLVQKSPLVSVASILALKEQLRNASLGQSFILQGGDCAESFQDSRPAMLKRQLKLMQHMIKRIEPSLGKPIIPIGRIAGQFAKPRTRAFETQGELTLPSYRGDLINHVAFNPKAREANPGLLLKGYSYAARTLRLIKHYHPEAFYTSHEALHLYYEAALTRNIQNQWYNLSTHLPWLGVRTAQIDSAQVEYLRGIHNPIGIKVGPNATPQHLVELLHYLNPQKKEGHLLLITRMGAKHIHNTLPPLIDAIKAHDVPVTWSCDPMHGNTEVTAEGVKTRHMDNIWDELEAAFQIHKAHNSHLAGLHLEMTPEPVTECLGGHKGPAEKDLKTTYKSLLDPRLNHTQALQLATRFKHLVAADLKPPNSVNDSPNTAEHSTTADSLTIFQ